MATASEDIKKHRQEIAKVGDGLVGRDIFYMVKSRYRIIYIVSPEETRVIKYFKHLSAAEGFDLFQWDCSRGVLDTFTQEPVQGTTGESDDPVAAIAFIIDQAKKSEQQLRQKQSKSDEDAAITDTCCAD